MASATSEAAETILVNKRTRRTHRASVVQTRSWVSLQSFEDCPTTLTDIDLHKDISVTKLSATQRPVGTSPRRFEEQQK